MSKSAAMAFSINMIELDWMWGKHKLPRVCSYSYLRIDFACHGIYHINKVMDSGRKRLSQLHREFAGRCHFLSFDHV